MAKLITRLRSLHNDSLFRNSFYLMLSTGIVSGFGFLFWILNTHLFSSEEIGLATALISAMNLISILSLLGFNTVLVRFLSRSEDANKDINTAVILTGSVASAISIFFVVFVDLFSPKLHFVQDPLLGTLFVLFCILTTLNILGESIFVAYRKTNYTLFNNTILSAIKMLLPFAFVGFGTFGIFASAAVAQAIGLVITVVVLVRTFNYKPRLNVDTATIQRVWRYSGTNYTAAIFNLLPVSILPLIITNHLGPSLTAYYYISMMIGNLLYVVPWSASRSLFAEGSHDESNLANHLKKAIRISLTFLLPGILAIFLLGKFVLTIFGNLYAEGDQLHFLWLVALAGIPLAINSTIGALLQIRKDPRSLLISNIFYSIAIIGLTYALLSQGLNGIGYAWIFGNATAAFISALCYYLFRKQD